MNSLLLKIFIILLIFVGEALAIYAEIVGAKSYSINHNLFFKIFFRMFLILAIGGALLIFGYILGFNVFKNIWIVSVISITSILIIEPILNYVIIEQLPTTGAVVGLIFGILGFIFTLTIK